MRARLRNTRGDLRVRDSRGTVPVMVVTSGSSSGGMLPRSAAAFSAPV